MKKVPFIGVAIAGILSASGAFADPYSSWSSASDDDSVSVSDSLNREWSYESNYSSDERQDNDVTTTTTTSEDFDYSSVYRTEEDNDIITTSSEDNDNHWSESTDVDFQIATPTLTAFKHQAQDAGHKSDAQAISGASGHSVGVEGGTNLVKAGSSETTYYGPALVNTNKNFLPQNNLFIQGHNGGDINQRNTVAGEDIGPKGVFAPLGNTTAHVMGNVGSQAGTSVDQSGDSANSIADPMSSTVQR